jgi:rhodanese-related sulfurtransferase
MKKTVIQLFLVVSAALVLGGIYNLATSSFDNHLAFSVPEGRYANALNCPKPSGAVEEPAVVAPAGTGTAAKVTPAPETPEPVKPPVSVPAETPVGNPAEKETPGQTTEEEKTPRILIASAFEEWEAGTLFIDARRTKSYVEGHIPGAISISPWESGREEKVARLAGDEPHEAPVVIYCTRSKDCEDSEMIASHLKQFEFSNVMVFQGGFPVWQEQEKPIAEGEEPGQRPGQ